VPGKKDPATVPRLAPEEWLAIREEREAGASLGRLAAAHGVSRAAISTRARAVKRLSKLTRR
jgi:hypothetical protein